MVFTKKKKKKHMAHNFTTNNLVVFVIKLGIKKI